MQPGCISLLRLEKCDLIKVFIYKNNCKLDSTRKATAKYLHTGFASSKKINKIK